MRRTRKGASKRRYKGPYKRTSKGTSKRISRKQSGGDLVNMKLMKDNIKKRSRVSNLAAISAKKAEELKKQIESLD
jgi:hypothetical protein